MIFLLVLIPFFSGIALDRGFCTTKNLYRFCRTEVVEFKIDSASMSPAMNCPAVFLWIPPRRFSGEENCYICAEGEALQKLNALAKKTPKKPCGRLIRTDQYIFHKTRWD